MDREYRYWNRDPEDSDSSLSESDVTFHGIQVSLADRSIYLKQTNDKLPKVSLEIQCGLNRLRHEYPESCDIELIVGKEIILAHKLVLSSCSSYFNAMFTKSFTETNRREVILNDVDDDMIKVLIDYMYTSELPYYSDDVRRILIMARYLQIDSAEKICEKYIIDHIDIKSCLFLIQWSGAQSVKKVTDALIKYIGLHFYELYIRREFPLIEIDELKKILHEPPVKNLPEDIIFTVIVRWVNHDNTSRLEYLDDLLNNINSSRVTKDLILSSTLGEYLPSDSLTNWMAKNETIDLNDITNWDFVVFKRTGHFRPKLYKAHSQAATLIKNSPKDFFDNSYISYGSNIYCFGGCIPKSQNTLNETYCYNIYKNKWTSFIPMLQRRAYHSSCIMNGQIYTCGGSDGYRAFKTAESIDLMSGVQTFLPDMLFPRESMAITSINNAIYVIGGKNRGICQYYSCERYDPRAGQWELLKNTSYLLGINSCAAVGYSIYCTNGKVMGLDRYDVVADQWTQIYTQYRSYPAEVFEMKNDLYGVFRQYIGLYEPTIGRWSIVNQLGCSHDHLVALPILVGPHSNIELESDQNNPNN